jgi:putative phosphoribosyl transferase
MICLPRHPYSPSEPDSPVDLHLTATLSVPRNAKGLLVLVQSEGRRQPGPLARGIAEGLRGAGMATCLIDLLNPDEAGEEPKLQSVELLTHRLAGTVEYLAVGPDTWHLPVGLLGEGMAAAAVLGVAAQRPDLVRAAIVCNGRPDLAPIDPRTLAVPTLLVVPAARRDLVELNEGVFLELRCTSQLAVVRGAGQQFSQSGLTVACQQVVRQWCRRHLRRPGRLPRNRMFPLKSS